MEASISERLKALELGERDPMSTVSRYGTTPGSVRTTSSRSSSYGRDRSGSREFLTMGSNSRARRGSEVTNNIDNSATTTTNDENNDDGHHSRSSVDREETTVVVIPNNACTTTVVTTNHVSEDDSGAESSSSLSSANNNNNNSKPRADLVVLDKGRNKRVPRISAEKAPEDDMNGNPINGYGCNGSESNDSNANNTSLLVLGKKGSTQFSKELSPSEATVVLKKPTKVSKKVIVHKIMVEGESPSPMDKQVSPEPVQFTIAPPKSEANVEFSIALPRRRSSELGCHGNHLTNGNVVTNGEKMQTKDDDDSKRGTEDFSDTNDHSSSISSHNNKNNHVVVSDGVNSLGKPPPQQTTTTKKNNRSPSRSASPPVSNNNSSSRSSPVRNNVNNSAAVGAKDSVMGGPHSSRFAYTGQSVGVLDGSFSPNPNLHSRHHRASSPGSSSSGGGHSENSVPMSNGGSNHLGGSSELRESQAHSQLQTSAANGSQSDSSDNVSQKSYPIPFLVLAVVRF